MRGRFLLKSPVVELQRTFGFVERPNLGARRRKVPSRLSCRDRYRRRSGHGEPR
jgi:hypothetical protein